MPLLRALIQQVDDETLDLIGEMSPLELFTKDAEGKTAFDLALTQGCDCCRESLLSPIIEKLATDPEILPPADLLNILHQLIDKERENLAVQFVNSFPFLSDADKSAALHKAVLHKQQKTALALIEQLPSARLSDPILDLAIQAQLFQVICGLQNRLSPELFPQEILRLYQSIERGDLETNLTRPLPDNAGFLALCFAIQKNRVQFALQLIRILPPEQLCQQTQDIDGLTPLHWAIHQQLEVVALALIDRLSAGQLCVPTKRGRQTALFWAIHHEALKRIALALIQKLSIERLCDSEDSRTALFWALRCSKENPEPALALIEKLPPERIAEQYPLEGLESIEKLAPQVAIALIEKYPSESVSSPFSDCVELELAWNRLDRRVVEAWIKKWPPDPVIFHSFSRSTPLGLALALLDQLPEGRTDPKLRKSLIQYGRQSGNSAAIAENLS